MRQRLLLVAGWATAAVVAVLVSTGAVAVAGGQVTDRPLRPLTASEVAALTEECDSTGRAPCLRQLDGSTDSQTSDDAAAEIGPDGGEDGVSRTPTDSAPSPSLADDTTDQGVDIDEGLLPPGEHPSADVVPEPSAEVVDMIGGRVSVSGADGEVRIMWLIPSQGYAVVPAGTAHQPDQVTVVLSDGVHQSTLVAEWDPVEGLVIDKSEGGVPSGTT